MRVNLSDFQLNKTDQSIKLYTLLGQETSIDEDGFPRVDTENDKVFAKAVKNKLSKKFLSDNPTYSFFIKTDPNHNIINPIETYSIKKINSNFLNKICKAESVFTEVTESIFNKYLNFLKTSNVKWLNSAQRELK
jgi:hypothetical protein